MDKGKNSESIHSQSKLKEQQLRLNPATCAPNHNGHLGVDCTSHVLNRRRSLSRHMSTRRRTLIAHGLIGVERPTTCGLSPSSRDVGLCPLPPTSLDDTQLGASQGDMVEPTIPFSHANLVSPRDHSLLHPYRMFLLIVYSSLIIKK